MFSCLSIWCLRTPVTMCVNVSVCKIYTSFIITLCRGRCALVVLTGRVCTAARVTSLHEEKGQKNLMKWKQSATHMECVCTVQVYACQSSFYCLKCDNTRKRTQSCNKNRNPIGRCQRICSHVSLPIAFIIVCSGKRWFQQQPKKLVLLSTIGFFSFYFIFNFILFYWSALLRNYHPFCFAS